MTRNLKRCLHATLQTPQKLSFPHIILFTTYLFWKQCLIAILESLHAFTDCLKLLHALLWNLNTKRNKNDIKSFLKSYISLHFTLFIRSILASIEKFTLLWTKPISWKIHICIIFITFAQKWDYFRANLEWISNSWLNGTFPLLYTLMILCSGLYSQILQITMRTCK